ncbi:uncharacterized protein LOC123539116 [Mercenaria mercenaria]|uniref:uncharacterized protein LOC123539116 n=1 Tax=Mercenaria mercenaria TaxID=6596 RepID=UPI00234E859D|nr:uncharacterized protein LOC123539116 [Mercenaria mercenaria]XP_053385971.1 uncharacterized protein LOC123539116 [Mercenaria mercenaria]
MLKSKGTVPAAGLLLEKVDKHKTDWDKLFVDVLEHFFMADIAKVFKMVEDNEETKIPAETTFIQPKKSRKREKFRKRRSEPVHNTHNTEDENKDNEICTGTERGLFENPAQKVDERLEVTRLFNVVIGIHKDLNAGLNRISQRLEEVCTAVGNLEEKFINRTYSKCEHSCQGGNEINNTSEK